MESLPNEILEEIAFHLNPKSVIQYGMTSRPIFSTLLNDAFWLRFCSKNNLLPERGTKAYSGLLSAPSCKAWLVQTTQRKLPLLDYFGPWMNPTLEYLCPLPKTTATKPKSGNYWLEIFTILPKGRWGLFLHHNVMGTLKFNVLVQVHSSPITNTTYSHDVRDHWDHWEVSQLCQFNIATHLAKVKVMLEESEVLAWKYWLIDYLEFRQI